MRQKRKQSNKKNLWRELAEVVLGPIILVAVFVYVYAFLWILSEVF